MFNKILIIGIPIFNYRSNPTRLFVASVVYVYMIRMKLGKIG